MQLSAVACLAHIQIDYPQEAEAAEEPEESAAEPPPSIYWAAALHATAKNSTKY